jgi:hypothetical protein
MEHGLLSIQDAQVDESKAKKFGEIAFAERGFTIGRHGHPSFACERAMEFREKRTEADLSDVRKMTRSGM